MMVLVEIIAVVVFMALMEKSVVMEIRVVILTTMMERSVVTEMDDGDSGVERIGDDSDVRFAARSGDGRKVGY